MKYFGFFKLETVENFDNEQLIDFLINNELFEEAVEETILFSEDFHTEPNLRKSINSFFLTLYGFTKVISKHLKEDLQQTLNIDKGLELTLVLSQQIKIKISNYSQPRIYLMIFISS